MMWLRGVRCRSRFLDSCLLIPPILTGYADSLSLLLSPPAVVHDYLEFQGISRKGETLLPSRSCERTVCRQHVPCPPTGFSYPVVPFLEARGSLTERPGITSGT
jgi:hypothetical protein